MADVKEYFDTEDLDRYFELEKEVFFSALPNRGKEIFPA